MIKMPFPLNCLCFCDKHVTVMLLLFVKKKYGNKKKKKKINKCGKRSTPSLKNKEHPKYNRIHSEGFKSIDINSILLHLISTCTCT